MAAINRPTLPPLQTEDGRVYQPVRVIQWGATGKVMEVLTPRNKTHRAMKVDNLNKDSAEEVQREGLILKAVHQRVSHIVKYYDHFNLTVGGKVGILMELLERPDCFEVFLQKRPPGTNLREVKNIGRQLAESLRDFHALGLIYGDLKLENIIYGDKLTILDLGSTFHKDSIDPLYPGGSREYNAPECILKAPFNTKRDIWSLGVVLFELYTGDRLFPTDRTNELNQSTLQPVVDHLHQLELNLEITPDARLIKSAPPNRRQLFSEQEDGTYKLDYPQSREGEKIMTDLLQKFPGGGMPLWEIRLRTAAEAKGENSTIEELIDLIKPMLSLNPDNRPTAAQVLQQIG